MERKMEINKAIMLGYELKNLPKQYEDCVVCGKSLDEALGNKRRSDSKYCSNKCRRYAKNERRRVKERYEGNLERKMTTNKAIIVGCVIVFILSMYVSVSNAYPSNYELEWVLDSFEHSQEYQTGVYDCTEMSICTAFFLQEVFGWDTIVAIGQCDEDGIYHAWVLVETNEDRWTAIETTTGGIGETRHGEDKYYHMLFAVEWYEVYGVTL